MIKLVSEGQYNLIETKSQNKILTLNGKTYVWINAAEIGEILVYSRKSHRTDNILAVGKYRVYDVKDEPELTDLTHLELLVGEGTWQGYLLPTGIPNPKSNRKRIIPTRELITKSTL